MIWTVLILDMAMAFTPARGEAFFLARDGKPAATIVIAKTPYTAASFGVSELQLHVRKISGAVLPILADGVPVAGPRILVGESAATRELGLSSADLEAQEYLIQFLPDALVLLGKDEDHLASPISFQGHIEWVGGKFGQGLSFDGTYAAALFADCGFSDDAGTLEAWIRMPDKPQAHHGTILRLDGKGPWTYHILQRVPNKSRIQYVTYDGKNGSSVISGELRSGWHHLAATFSAEECRQELFVDGVSQGKAVYRKTTCKGMAVNIGGIARPAKEQTDNTFRGRIDEIRISTVRQAPSVKNLGRPEDTDRHTKLLLHLDEGRGLPEDSSGTVRPASPPGPYDLQGTSYAVHDFLERFCRVRWYGPGELGVVLPKSGTLKVSARDIRRSPAFLWRMPHPRYPGGIAKVLWNNPHSRDMDLFWARLRIGGEKYACNHSFYGYYDRFLKGHPDWFAQGYEGRPPQMCYSSPGFTRQVIQDARDYFDGKGAKKGGIARGDYFALVPMDNSLWCKRDECQSQMNQDQKDHPQFSNGFASDYVFNFANRVARELAKTHPGRFLSTIAYHDYYAYPRQTILQPNISVQLCMTVRHWWAPFLQKTDLDAYRAWTRKEKGRRLFLWLYYCFPETIAARQGWNCFPGFFAHTAARQIKMFARDRIRGAFLNGLGEQVDTYVTLKLFDDPSLDVDQLLDEFFTRYYGSAARPMKRLYLRIEEIFSSPKYYPEEVQKEDRLFHQTEEMAWGYLGTEERMKEMGGIMAEAVVAAKTGIEKQRVGLFKRAIWDYMLEGRRKYLARAEK